MILKTFADLIFCPHEIPHMQFDTQLMRSDFGAFAHALNLSPRLKKWGYGNQKVHPIVKLYWNAVKRIE